MDAHPRRLTVFIGFMLILGAAAPAIAGPFDLYGAGARGSAMGAQTSSPNGPGAIYYNVGGLVNAEPGVTVGGFATANQAQILLKQRPEGYDIPDFGQATPTLPSNQTLSSRSDTESIAPLYAITFGGVTSLGIDRLRIGILGFLPTAQILELKTRFPDERERIFSNQLHWEFLDQTTRRFDIEAGIAYRITDWFSFGIGGTFLTGAQVGTRVYLEDPTDQGNIQINSDVKTRNDWGLLAGATIDLPYRFRLGLSYRGPVRFRVQGANRLQLKDVDEDDRIEQVLDWTPKYSPSTLAGGLSWTVGDFEIAFDARLVLWSGYRNTHSEETNFSNTLNTRLGLEYLYSPDSRLRVGLGFDPTPVPDQSGRTNYVDTSRALLSLGSGHRYTVSGVDFEVNWFLQGHLLFERDVVKSLQNPAPTCAPDVTQVCDEMPDDFVDPDTGQPAREARGLQTGNPGFPGFVAGGWLAALGLEVTF